MGSKVEKFKVGDKVGVGYMVGSCHSCDSCTNNLETYCPKLIATYRGKYYDETVTYGGFSDTMVVDEHIIIRIPHNLPLDAVASLLCDGLTVYSSLRFYGLDKLDLHIGIVGLGGLGHLPVKFAKDIEAKVAVISNSTNMKKEALENLGVDSSFVSRDHDQLQV